MMKKLKIEQPATPGDPLLLLPHGDHPGLKNRVGAGVGGGARLAVRFPGAHPLLRLLLQVFAPVGEELAVHVLHSVDARTLGLVDRLFFVLFA